MEEIEKKLLMNFLNLFKKISCELFLMISSNVLLNDYLSNEFSNNYLSNNFLNNYSNYS